MKHRRVALHLAWIGLLFVAAAGMAATFEGSGTPAGVLAGTPHAVVPPDGAPAVDPPATEPPTADPCDPPATDDFTPVACKRLPECDVNADCVAWCGPTGGHCVHSSCPIRICKCS